MVGIVTATVIGGWLIAHLTSPLNRRWHRSSLARRAAGPLSVLDSGSARRADKGADEEADEEVVVLLHGLGATGDYFGAFYDDLGRHRRLVIVDLLGFGRSLDVERDDFGVDDHVDALDAALRSIGAGAAPTILAAHSMSSAIALTWADRHRERTRHVYLWGAPVYPANSATQSVARQYGLMGRLFALDTKWAERACRINCINRNVSGRVMAVMAPRWPTEVSRGASRHTWAAYHQSLRNLVLDFDWSRVLPAGVAVTAFYGADDPIGDRHHLAELIGENNVVTVPESTHHIALEQPELLVAALTH